MNGRESIQEEGTVTTWQDGDDTGMEVLLWKIGE
jgi:hypothetical protein